MQVNISPFRSKLNLGFYILTCTSSSTASNIKFDVNSDRHACTVYFIWKTTFHALYDTKFARVGKSTFEMA